MTPTQQTKLTEACKDYKPVRFSKIDTFLAGAQEVINNPEQYGLAGSALIDAAKQWAEAWEHCESTHKQGDPEARIEAAAASYTAEMRLMEAVKNLNEGNK